MWILYSILGAASQAFGAAIKKKSLQARGMNNVIGFVSFMTAGIAFGCMHFASTGHVWIDGLSIRFWQGMFWYAGLNIIAVWFAYKALDLAEFSRLMPFMTLTSVLMIVPPMFVLGEFPSVTDVFGIILVVAGAVYMNWSPAKKAGETETDAEAKLRHDNVKGILYFLITALCYTITPTAAKVSIQESSAIFSSFVVHALMGLGFLSLIFVFREYENMKSAFRTPPSRFFLPWVAVAGLIIVIENGSINTALAVAPVASVMAVKRLMPLFAFLIGYFYFKERTELPKKLVATALMVAGAILITIL